MAKLTVSVITKASSKKVWEAWLNMHQSASSKGKKNFKEGYSDQLIENGKKISYKIIDVKKGEGFTTVWNSPFIKMHFRYEVQQEKKQGLITVKTYQEDNAVIISVSDTGTGISEEIRERIFDYFFTTKDVGKGSGQGLSMAYDMIVNRHGGKIWFETEVGKGTTFYIKLPITE